MTGLDLAADAALEQPVRQGRIYAARPVFHLQNEILAEIAQRDPDRLIRRTVATGGLEGIVDEIAQHCHQLGTADTKGNVVQMSLRVDLQHQPQLMSPVILAKQQPCHLGLGDGPHQEAEQGLLGSGLPPDEGERLLGGTELDQAGNGAELVVVFVGLYPQQVAVGLHLGELSAELGQLILAPKARHGADQLAVPHQRQPVDDELLAVEHYLFIKLGTGILNEGEHAALRQQAGDGLAYGRPCRLLVEAQQPDAIGVEGGEPPLFIYGEDPFTHRAQGTIQLRIEAPDLLGLEPQQGPLVAARQPGSSGAVEQDDNQSHRQTKAQKTLQIRINVAHQITDRHHADDLFHLVADRSLAAH